MKIIAALLSRFSRRNAETPDVFDQRLRSMTKPVARSRQARRQSAPVLFRRDFGHA